MKSAHTQSKGMHAFSSSLVLASFAVPAALYGRLPEAIPTHWNLQGQVDGYSPKPWGPFLLPFSMVGIYALLWAAQRMSPKGYRIEAFQGSFEVIRAALLALLAFCNVLVLMAATGAQLPIERVVPASMGLFFCVLGNWMSKFRKNFFLGIRTPWTLASDEVWLRTHRLAGRLFVATGLLLLLFAPFGASPALMLIALGIASTLPILYSYLVYRRIEGFKDSAPHP